MGVLRNRKLFDRAHVGVLVALLAFAVPIGATDDVPPPRPERASVGASEAGISVSGELEAADAVWVGRRAIHWRHSSDVLEKIVPEGTRVSEGDFLLQVDTEPWERDKEDAEGEAKGAELEVAAARSSLAAAVAALEAEREKQPARLAPYRLAVERLEKLPDPVELSAAESELERRRAMLTEAGEQLEALETLAGEQMVPDQARVEARFARDLAQAEFDKAHTQYELVRAGAAPSELAIAGAELAIAGLEAELQKAQLTAKAEEAKLELRKAERSLGYWRKQVEFWEKEIPHGTRYAPSDGIVVYQKAWVGFGGLEKIQPGATVWRGMRILAVVSGRQFRFRGRLDEAGLGRIRVGQPARVELAALPDTVLNGRVTAVDVALEKEAVTGRLRSDLERLRSKEFEALIELAGVPEGLMPGLSGTGVIELTGTSSFDGGGNAAQTRGDRIPASDGGPDRDDWAGLPRFAGYVDAVEKTPVFNCHRAAGEVTYVAPQYSWQEQGDVIMETTGHRALAYIRQIEHRPELARQVLEQTKLNLAAEMERWQAEAEKAKFEVEIAELRLAQLHALPGAAAVAMGRADLRKATLTRDRAQHILEVARLSGLDSQRELEARELDVRLAGLQVEEAQLRLNLIRKGAGPDSIGEAELAVEEAQEHLAYAQAMADQLANVRGAAIAFGIGGRDVAKSKLEEWLK